MLDWHSLYYIACIHLAVRFYILRFYIIIYVYAVGYVVETHEASG